LSFYSYVFTVKRLFLYLLIAVYIAVQVKPLTLVVHDLFAHTFFRMQHLATVHYEDGKYHLHTELATTADENKDASSTSLPLNEKTGDHFPVQVFHGSPGNICLNNLLLCTSHHACRFIPAAYLQVTAPPPRML
jgi:hypothetical protein